MPSAKGIVRAGPFTGGLNLRNATDDILDNELVKALNVFIDIDGTIKPRPGFARIPPNGYLDVMSKSFGSFETDHLAGVWDYSDGIIGDLTIGFTDPKTFTALDGTYALYLRRDTTTTDIVATILDSSYYLPVLPSTLYEINAYFKAKGTTKLCHVGFRWFRSNLSQTGSDVYGTGVTDSTSSWTLAAHTATSPSDAAYCAPLYKVVSPSTGATNEHYVDKSTIFRSYTGLLGSDFSSSTKRFDLLGIIDNKVITGVSDIYAGTWGSKYATVDVFTCDINGGDDKSNAWQTTANWTGSSRTPSALPYRFVKVIKYNGYFYAIPSAYSGYTPASFGISRFTDANLSTGRTDYTITGFRGVGGDPVGPTSPAGNTFDSYQDKAFVFKDRLFLVDGDTVYFSKPGDFSVWTAPDGGYFKINPGNDGDYITAVAVTDDVIYFFKPNTTISFIFQTDPNSDGYARTISIEYGAHSATVWRNRVFVFNTNSVFELVSGQFIDLGQKIDLTGAGKWPRMPAVGAVFWNSMFLLKNFLVVGPEYHVATLTSGQYFKGRYFAFNLLTGTWTEWMSYDPIFNTLSATEQYLDEYTHEYDPNSGVIRDAAVPAIPGIICYGKDDESIYFMSNISGRELVVVDFILDIDNNLGYTAYDGIRYPKYSGTDIADMRLPWYLVRTKKFNIARKMRFSKIYNILVDRGFPSSGVGGQFSLYPKGFFITFDTAKPESNQYVTALNNPRYLEVADEWGRFKNSQFRCYSFDLGFQLKADDQNSASFGRLDSHYFSINQWEVEVASSVITPKPVSSQSMPT